VTTLVLSNVSLLTVPLADAVTAAAEAGFDAVSVLARSHRYAVERAGFTTDGIRELAERSGVAITDVETVSDWLAPEPADVPRPTFVYPSDEMIELAAALGAPTLTALHSGPRPVLDDAAPAFARLCDRAASAGVQIALEFAAWMGIASLADAWDVVRAADRPNGGLLVDLWHHRRTSTDDELLRSIPPDRIFSVQVCDATAQPIGPLEEDVTHRMLPGRGELDVVGFLRTLGDMGVDAPIGIEVFDGALVADGAPHAARELHRVLREVVAEAGLA
jgi:sugar phosphate isomerase/epimerase